jgi:hypothetical protein
MSNSLMQEMTALLADSQACSGAEHANVVATLAESDYAMVANLLSMGATMTKTTLPALDQLGRLPTCFAKLGPYVASTLHSEPRFRISQAARILGYNERLGDGKKQVTLRHFKDKIAQGHPLAETIVLLRTPQKIAIIACNTRAIAIYDAGIQRPVQVFVIASDIPQTDWILDP